MYKAPFIGSIPTLYPFFGFHIYIIYAHLNVSNFLSSQRFGRYKSPTFEVCQLGSTTSGLSLDHETFGGVRRNVRLPVLFEPDFSKSVGWVIFSI